MAAAVEKIPAVVLAGGVNHIELYPGYRPGLKALLLFAGRPSLQHVLDALQAAPRVGDVVVIGPPSELQTILKGRRDIELLPDAGSLTANLERGARHFADLPRVLFVPADLPLVSPQAIEAFLSASLGRQGGSGDFFWAMVERRSFQGRFQYTAKGFDRFRNLSVCHGNLFLMKTSLVKYFEANVRLEKLYRARKSALRSALVCGPQVLLGFFFGVKLMPLLTLRGMARLISRRFGFILVPVLVDHPEVALDIDEAQDYCFVREHLEHR